MTSFGRSDWCRPTTFAVLVLTGCASDARAQRPEAFQVSVDVSLVALHATVRDQKDQFASALREQDFQVYEDGVRQSIRLFRHEDSPVTVGLVVDHSSSMRPKLAEVITAARTFVRCSNREDQMFVINFNESVTFGLPGAIRFTDRLDELASAILKVSAGGETALYDAVVQAQERLQGGTLEKKL